MSPHHPPTSPSSNGRADSTFAPLTPTNSLVSLPPTCLMRDSGLRSAFGSPAPSQQGPLVPPHQDLDGQHCRCKSTPRHTDQEVRASVKVDRHPQAQAGHNNPRKNNNYNNKYNNNNATSRTYVTKLAPLPLTNHQPGHSPSLLGPNKPSPLPLTPLLTTTPLWSSLNKLTTSLLKLTAWTPTYNLIRKTSTSNKRSRIRRET